MVDGEGPQDGLEQLTPERHELVESLQAQARALRAEMDALKAENAYLWELLRDGSVE